LYLTNQFIILPQMKQSSKQKQLHFLKNLNISNKKTYGGITKGKRKVARPISSKKWSHLVLKSSKAKGNLSLSTSTNSVKVNTIIKKQALKHGVQISDFVNMGNHLHLKVRPHSRTGFQRFLKSTTAMIARAVTGAKKGFKFGKFWDGLAFTRVIQSGYELFQLKGYFEANRVESKKGYQQRLTYLNAFNGWLRSLRLQT
jgi:REP element-mobilizing transposase RayT